MFWTNFPLRIDATTQIICKIEIIIIVGKKLKLTDVASFSSSFFFSDPDKKINFVIFSLIVLKVRWKCVSDEVDEFILRLLMLIKQTSKKIKYKKDIFPQ